MNWPISTFHSAFKSLREINNVIRRPVMTAHQHPSQPCNFLNFQSIPALPWKPHLPAIQPKRFPCNPWRDPLLSCYKAPDHWLRCLRKMALSRSNFDTLRPALLPLPQTFGFPNYEEVKNWGLLFHKIRTETAQLWAAIQASFPETRNTSRRIFPLSEPSREPQCFPLHVSDKCSLK